LSHLAAGLGLRRRWGRNIVTPPPKIKQNF